MARARAGHMLEAMNSGAEQLRVDFAGGAVGYRFRRGHERNHALVKAAGVKKDRIPTIVDATAIAPAPGLACPDLLITRQDGDVVAVPAP